MITNPTITIGMPVYNGSNYIREAIDSLLKQTFSDFELIISDNASTDDTKDICEQYVRNDSRITYVRQNKNLGPLANFKFVLDSAKSEYFMWAAADDKWDKTWLEDIYTNIQNKPSMAGFGQLEHIDSNSAKLAHVANGRNLSFQGPALWRKIRFYLAYEGLGKANLFYAIYPRLLLKNINWETKRQDYQILFSQLRYLGYLQTPKTKLYKRIHSTSEGNASESVFRKPLFMAPIRLLIRDINVAKEYLDVSKTTEKILIWALLPIKVFLSTVFHIRHLAQLCKSKFLKK